MVDAGGHKIASLEAVYVDTTEEPAMATARMGLPARHRPVFVPLDGAIVGPGYVKVDYAAFQHYELPYEAGASGERQRARR